MIQSGQWKNNVKQVIRVTLVGIDPSDQVQIKGYLRIILRVDFDIEWVSPKNPKVDLFIVNQAFSNSDSVKALINQSQAPVLFVANAEGKANTIEGNTLFLKLSHVAILEAWLNQNVPKIYENNNSDQLIKTAIQTTNSENTPAPTTTLNDEAIAASKHFNNDNQPTLTTQVSSVQKNGLTENALTLINSINNKSSENYYEIIFDDEVVAIFHPNQRLVWPRGDSFYPAFAYNWQIIKMDTPPNLEVKHALNLNTWIWICALTDTSNITQILPLNAKLSLKTWPKPQNNSDKSDYLRILAMTELQPLSVNDIAKKTNISIDKIHKCMSALYMAGFMDSGLLTLDVYVKQQLKQYAKPNTSNIPTQQPTASTETEQASEEQLAKLKEKSYINEEDKPAKAKSFSGGFLARIRSTLGF